MTSPFIRPLMQIESLMQQEVEMSRLQTDKALRKQVDQVLQKLVHRLCELDDIKTNVAPIIDSNELMKPEYEQFRADLKYKYKKLD